MQRFLLDTNVFLWWLAGDSQLGEHAKSLISDSGNQVYVSAASIWEISIERTKGNWACPEDMDSIVEGERMRKLPISLYHAEQAGLLQTNNSDLFDCVLIAQAQAEGLTLVTADPVFQPYNVLVRDARV